MLFLVGLAPESRGQGDLPVDFTVAFIGDQGNENSASQRPRAVLELIAAEGADVVVHAGDFDYANDPAAWDALITDVLGPDFPYFANVGNHDTLVYYGPGGYQEFLAARMGRLGLAWRGDLGVRSSFTYAGILFVLTAPDVFASGDGDAVHAPFVRDELAATDAVWRVSSWHKNMTAMQVGAKTNDTGWGVYEESRRGGAIIATGHEHSYSRTHLLASMATQTVANTENTLVLSGDDPATGPDEGRSFAFVSGIAGRSIRVQRQLPTPPWWASVYSATQGANYGALFGIFKLGGDPRLAWFYFKDIDGIVADSFFVRSTVGDAPVPVCSAEDADGDGVCDADDNCVSNANTWQTDTDRDGYGNACDADYDQDGWVGSEDFNRFRTAFGTALGAPAYDPAHDVDADHDVDLADFRRFARMFTRRPGPSGLACAGTTPCPAP